jgi:hypothetical protein
MSSQSDPVAKVKNWSIQAISFAISLRADATGKPVTPKFIALANKEAETIALDFWNEAVAETEPNVPSQVIIMKAAQKTFDWCSSYMNPEK